MPLEVIVSDFRTKFLGESQKDNARERLKKVRFTGATTEYHTKFNHLVDETRAAGQDDPIPASNIMKMFLNGTPRVVKTGTLLQPAYTF